MISLPVGLIRPLIVVGGLVVAVIKNVDRIE
jgi:hypothetical protein